MKRMVRRYKALDVNRVDLVDRGANLDIASGDGSHIVLAKRAQPDPEILPGDEDGRMAKAIKALLKALGIKDQLTFEEPVIEPDITHKQEQTMDATKTAEQAAEIQKAVDAAVAKAVETAMATAKAQADAQVAELTKRAETAEAQAKSAEEIAKAERDARELARYEGVAKGFQGVGVTVTDAPVLKRLHEGAATPEDAKRVMELLKAAQTQIETGKMFSTMGSDGRDNLDAQSAEARVFAKAAALRTVDPKKSEADAITEVIETDRALANEYAQERKNLIR